MRQTYYMHDGAHFDCPQQHRNVMADPQGLLSIAADAHIEGHDAMALRVRGKLELAALLLRMAKFLLLPKNFEIVSTFTVDCGPPNHFCTNPLVHLLIYLFNTQPSSISRFKSTHKILPRIAILKLPCHSMVFPHDHGNHGNSRYGFPHCQQLTSFGQ
jgi:hypothetical protein